MKSHFKRAGIQRRFTHRTNLILSSYYVPRSILGKGDSVVNKKIPALTKLLVEKTDNI